MQFKSWLLLASLPLFAILPVSIIGVLAQEPAGDYVIRQVEVWGLFYRMMVAAFIVGAIVNGIIVYVIWRYRESHKKNKLSRESMESSGI